MRLMELQETIIRRLFLDYANSNYRCRKFDYQPEELASDDRDRKRVGDAIKHLKNRGLVESAERGGGYSLQMTDLGQI